MQVLKNEKLNLRKLYEKRCAYAEVDFLNIFSCFQSFSALDKLRLEKNYLSCHSQLKCSVNLIPPTAFYYYTAFS